MKPSLPQPNERDSRWDEVRAALPHVQRWLALVAELVHDGHIDADALQAPSEKDVRCSETTATECDKQRNVTASVTTIRNTDGVPVELLPKGNDERRRLTSIFDQYQECREAFSRHQWPAICLRFRDGLTEAQVAASLNKSRSAVYGLLDRARKIEEAHRQRLRAEGFRLARKHLNPCE